MNEKTMMTGAEILLNSLVAEGVETVFGYPGGQIMSVYNKLYDFKDKLNHVLVRHEQGAIHAAQGYARAKGVPGVVIVTSGPGASNVITGVADAMIDSTPVVVISGQVPNNLLGTDAFQETDVIGLTSPITKWNCQVRRAEDVSDAVAKAFYIASTGRPGPVVIDITKDAQNGLAEYSHEKCDFIRTYVPYPKASQELIDKAAEMINNAQKPFIVYGQGVILSGAEKELEEMMNKAGIPAGSTLMGLSAIPNDNPHYKGMVGMHGNIATNVMTQECDVLIAVGMRFDDRVTGTPSQYAPNAKVIHIDIDDSEIGKNIPVDLGIVGDAKSVLSRINAKLNPNSHDEWEIVSSMCYAVEKHKVIEPEISPEEGNINMGEVVNKIAELSNNEALIVTDVGQNQMIGARYSKFARTRSMITSGGLGTMGFGLPAAIGAKIGCPDRKVCLLVGDGGLQMTIQEFGTIMQENTGVKIVLLNNNWLGNVRMWQELFFDERYSFTRMENPDYEKIASAYGIRCRNVEKREELEEAILDMFSDDNAFLLNIHVEEKGMVFPMVPPGKSVIEMLIDTDEWYEYGE